MDEIVLRGMAKWPNVPAVYGWLALNRRGEWLIKGERIGNPMVTAFICRNYERDERGCWFFQNGPQRVFVTLDYTPFVYRAVNPEGAQLALECHTGDAVTLVTGTWLDEQGTLLIETEHGAGIVHDRDLDRLLPHLTDAHGKPSDETALEQLMERLQRQGEAPLWFEFGGRSARIESIRCAEVPERFGFVREPRAPAEEEPSR